MRICHLISSIGKGGAETHLYSLVKKQIQNKNSIIIIYLKGNDFWKKYYNKIGVKTYKLSLLSIFNLFRLIEVYFKIKNICSTFKPDIIHSHLLAMELIGAILKYNLTNKFKLVVTKHLDSFFLEASFGRANFIKGVFIDRFIISQSNKVICISKQVKKYFLLNIPEYKNKYSVIHYGFSFEEFKFSKNKSKFQKKLKQEYKIKNNDLVLCNIARHVRQKSLDILLKGFSEYAALNNNSRLILVGKGPETQNLKKLSIDLKINKKIIWIKNCDNIRDIYELSDIFILTSQYEGLGLVLLESMASKMPIIASKISAIPEVVINNFNGYLFNYGDYKILPKKILNLENKYKRKIFGQNGYQLLKKKFNLNEMHSKTMQVYNKII